VVLGILSIVVETKGILRRIEEQRLED